LYKDNKYFSFKNNNDSLIIVDDEYTGGTKG